MPCPDAPRRFRLPLQAALLALLCGALLSPWPGGRTQAGGPAVSLTVDGAQQFQVMDGFGVNANPKNWNDRELVPAIDLLVDQLGATIWRVDVFGKSDWETTNDDGNPNTFNWSYYNALYNTPSFQELWNTLDYLNQKDVRILLSMSGVVPEWMGGPAINVSAEDEWVEMIASLVYYARNVRGIDFTLLSPLNEPDLGEPEGALVSTSQFAALVHKLVVRLGALGLGDVEIVPPEPAFLDTGYLAPLFADATIMAHVQHFSFHNYTGATGGVNSAIEGSAYPDRNFWMTEWSQTTTDGLLDGGAQVADEWAFARTMTDYLMNHLRDGAAAGIAWDAFDNIHEHDPSGFYTHWGLLAYDLNTGRYAPKKRFYSNAQVFKFVPEGAVRIAADEAYADLQVFAFRDAATGRLTIVGQNLDDVDLTLNGSLLNVPSAPQTFALYRTSETLDLARQANVPVTAGAFSIAVPADSFFTLTGLPGAPEGTPPSISGVTAQNITTTGARVVWTTNEAADSRVEYGLTAAYGESTVVDAALVTLHSQPLVGLLPDITYHYRVRSTDASGNTSVSGDDTFITPAAAATLTVTFDDLPGENQPLNGPYPDGVIDWGTGNWFHSGPFGLFATKSAGFNGGTLTSASLSFVTPRRLISLRAYNGGDYTRITLSCPDQITKQADLVPGELVTIQTGWTGTCTSVTVGSTNGWDTNFDTLVLASSGAPQGPDGDGDGCSDAAEQGLNPAAGGLRNPSNLWDFYDVPTGSFLQRDRAVAGADIAAVVLRFGSNDTGPGAFDRNSDPLSTPNPVVSPAGSRQNYHPAYDRGGTVPGGYPWTLLPANGALSGGDVAATVLQFGHSCI